MNSRRRAELQRKLSMNAVPRPPAGLRERIQADIPRHLEAEKPSGRFGRTAAFNMRAAAAVALLVTSLAAMVLLVDREPRTKPADTTPGARPIVFAPQPRAISAPAASATEEVSLDIPRDTSATMAPPLVAENAMPPALPARRERAEANASERDMEQRVADESSVPMAEGVVRMDEMTEARQIAEAAPSPAARAAAPAAMAPPPPPQDAVHGSERLTVTASAPAAAPPAGFLSKAQSAEMQIVPKKSVFGVSVDPNAFDELRATLEAGRRPQPGEVDVEALVNYFAGASRAGSDESVQFDVEASPAAVGTAGDHAVLRLSVDTVPATIPGSLPPVASEVRIDVEFNRNVVSSARRIGNPAPLAPEPVLLAGTSVTTLYAIELKPNLRSNQLVASVRFQYTSVASGHRRTVTRHIRSQDLARGWKHASRRHRLATLGAVWGETLKGTAAARDLADRAEELAAQDPKNPRARELADAASASGGL